MPFVLGCRAFVLRCCMLLVHVVVCTVVVVCCGWLRRLLLVRQVGWSKGGSGRRLCCFRCILWLLDIVVAAAVGLLVFVVGVLVVVVGCAVLVLVAAEVFLVEVVLAAVEVVVVECVVLVVLEGLLGGGRLLFFPDVEGALVVGFDGACPGAAAVERVDLVLVVE